MINEARMNAESMYNNNNQAASVNWRWRTEGQLAEIPRALYNKGFNYLGSDRFVEDATYVRLKTLTLCYNVPKKFLSKLGWGISACKIYATGYDLFTLTIFTSVLLFRSGS